MKILVIVVVIILSLAHSLPTRDTSNKEASSTFYKPSDELSSHTHSVLSPELFDILKQSESSLISPSPSISTSSSSSPQDSFPETERKQTIPSVPTSTLLDQFSTQWNPPSQPSTDQPACAASPPNLHRGEVSNNNILDLLAIPTSTPNLTLAPALTLASTPTLTPTPTLISTPTLTPTPTLTSIPTRTPNPTPASIPVTIPHSVQVSNNLLSDLDQTLNHIQNLSPTVSYQKRIQDPTAMLQPYPPSKNYEPSSPTHMTSLSTPYTAPPANPSSLLSSSLVQIQPIKLTPKCSQELMKLLSDLPATSTSQEPVQNQYPSDPSVLSDSPNTSNQFNSPVNDSLPNPNSNPSLAISAQPALAAKPVLNPEFIKYLSTLPSCQKYSNIP